METVNAENKAEMYDIIDHYIAEIYDQVENDTEDVALINSLVGEQKVRILEPFCGHGRILIPLADAGHDVVGIDLSEQLLQSLDERLHRLPENVRHRVSFFKADVLTTPWPASFDVVVLGGNCFYELATPDQQEHCIRSAALALRPGGYLYLDNDHMEGELAPSWYKPGVNVNAFPTGMCADGTQVRGTCETIWYDAANRLVRFRRTATIQTPDGITKTREWFQQKHPPSVVEMTGWLRLHGFEIKSLWGDRRKSPYFDSSNRAIFWAKKC